MRSDGAVDNADHDADVRGSSELLDPHATGTGDGGVVVVDAISAADAEVKAVCPKCAANASRSTRGSV